LAAVLVYFVLVHRRVFTKAEDAVDRKRVPVHLFRSKESAVGAVLALGVSLSAWTKIQTPFEAATVALFAILCSLNCAVIDSWECGRRTLCQPAFVVIIVAAALLALRQPAMGAAEAASAAGLFFLCGRQRNFSRNALRVLADVPLLSPLLFLPAAGLVQ
jgi:hypothetical protein